MGHIWSIEHLISGVVDIGEDCRPIFNQFSGEKVVVELVGVARQSKVVAKVERGEVQGGIIVVYTVGPWEIEDNPHSPTLEPFESFSLHGGGCSPG